MQGRICRVGVDPVLPVKAFVDIGGAGHSSDAMAIWIAQFVGREIRLLDYIEGVGQPLGYYANELRRRGWKEAVIHLPHDGVARNVARRDEAEPFVAAKVPESSPPTDGM